MKTQLSAANPFGYNRFGFAFEALKDGTPRRHLDYGCFDGSFIGTMRDALSNNIALIGVDVNEDALHALGSHNVEIPRARISDRGSLPFRDRSFDSISCLEVLEHISAARRQEVLREFWRILSPNGFLIVSVPEQHLFSALDLANVKFRVPRLHRLFVQLRRGRAYYDERYRNNRFRLIGDVSVDAGWHQHFSPVELSQLLASEGFEVLDIDGAGFFTLPLVLVTTLLPLRPVQEVVHRMQVKDSEAFNNANLFLTCRRAAAVDT